MGVDTSPSTQVGTELLFENDAVRVWNMDLAPDERSPYHIHHLDYVIVYLTPSRITYRNAPDDSGITRRYADGHVNFVAVPDEGVSHQIQNASEEHHRQVVIELKTVKGVAPTRNNGRVTDEPIDESEGGMR